VKQLKKHVESYCPMAQRSKDSEGSVGAVGGVSAPLYSIADQIECVAREIAMRERVYPNFVRSGKKSQGDADAEIAKMRAVLRTLEWLRENEQFIKSKVEIIASVEEEAAVREVRRAFPDARVTYIKTGVSNGAR